MASGGKRSAPENSRLPQNKKGRTSDENASIHDSDEESHKHFNQDYDGDLDQMNIDFAKMQEKAIARLKTYHQNKRRQEELEQEINRYRFDVGAEITRHRSEIVEDQKQLEISVWPLITAALAPLSMETNSTEMTGPIVSSQFMIDHGFVRDECEPILVNSAKLVEIWRQMTSHALPSLGTEEFRKNFVTDINTAAEHIELAKKILVADAYGRFTKSQSNRFSLQRLSEQDMNQGRLLLEWGSAKVGTSPPTETVWADYTNSLSAALSKLEKLAR